jgi:hypothetical protein
LYTYNGQYVNFSTGEKIAPEHWEPKKGMVKKTYGRGHIAFNDLLKTKVQDIEEIKRMALQQKIEPMLEYVKEQFSLKSFSRIEANQDFYFLFEQFIKETLHRKRAIVANIIPTKGYAGSRVEEKPAAQSINRQ